MSLGWAETAFFNGSERIRTREGPGGKGPEKTFQHRGCTKSFSFFIIHARLSQMLFMALQATDWQRKVFFSLFFSFFFPLQMFGRKKNLQYKKKKKS